MSTGAPLLLASRSPRRRALLAQIGVGFEPVDAGVDETPRAGEMPAALVERLARAKTWAGVAAAADTRPVLGADTTVTLDGEVLGKPDDEARALEMLARLSGRTHEVVTGVAVVRGDAIEARVVATRVTLRPISQAERRAYWASGEPAGKAGAYAIQGLGAVFVERIEGSYSNVVGLPLLETAELLKAFGIDVLASYGGG